MVNLVNSNNNRTYVIGAGAGLVSGAAMGALSSTKGTAKQLEALDKAGDTYKTALRQYQRNILVNTGEASQFDLINKAVYDSKDIVELREKANKAPKDLKLKKEYEAKFVQKQNEFLKCPEHKGLQETLNVGEKQFNNTEAAKKMQGNIQEASTKLKSAKIKWIAGIAAIGTVLGLATAHVVNHFKNKTQTK